MKHMNQRQSVIRSWRTTALSAAILISLTAISTPVNSATDNKEIGDLEIYQPAKPGAATIFMMLDISGSMGVVPTYDSINKDYNVSCPRRGYGELSSEEIKAYVRKSDGSTQLIKYQPKGCTITSGWLWNQTTKTYLDRLSRLQIALINLLADEVVDNNGNKVPAAEKGSLPNDYEIGLGVYSHNNDSKTGVVLVPTEALKPDQRIKLITKIGGLEALGGTPTAQALAEAGAYMMGTTTKNSPYSSYSGFDNSVVESKNPKDRTKYKSPLNSSECSGNGIYLLTDGVPGNSSDEVAKTVMNASLIGTSATSTVNQCNSLGGTTSQAWGCMAEYAGLLRKHTVSGETPSAPRKSLPINTATVGFGSEFKGLNVLKDIYVNGTPEKIIDCESGSVATNETNIRNLCRLGERKDDNATRQVFGGGGFYYTEESKDIAASITDFAANLVQVINTAPSGTITIPNDPYRASNQLGYAYLPMLDPDIASTSSIWNGNLKKYKLNQGTLFGKNDQKLYKDISGELNSDAPDLWQNGNSSGSNKIDVGGVYARLKAPNSASSMRTVYVEDHTSKDDKTPILRKLSVVDGKAVGFDALIDVNKTTDTGTYNQLNKRRILSFLGFDNLLNDRALAKDNVKVEELTLTAPTAEIKVLGGVVHSTPEAVSYSATLDNSGRIIDPRDDYVLFGSMDGALHMADAESGEETFAIIPRQIIINQAEALVSDSKKREVGEPYFGVDAPWLVVTDYKYDLDSTPKKVTVDESSGKGMFAYGGLRMGGEAFYGMKITKKTAPEMLFTITKDGLSSTDKKVIKKEGFERLGQIWSKPTAAKIRINKDDANPTDVLIFGGGYDKAYENDGYVATSLLPAKGNAIYMINAKTGELIWSTSGLIEEGKDVSMFHSITGEITVLDRDNDGLTDHIYAADLGGQVFRVDLQNARTDKFGFEEITKFSVKPPIRILDASPKLSEAKYAYRFYERPVVSFYRREGGPDNGKLFALVNVISGNRSSPLSELRTDNKYANRVYGIIDSDVTRSDLYTLTKRKVENLTEENLVNLATTLGTQPNKEKKNDTKELMITGSSQGWFYPLIRFDGKNNVKYNKSMGDSAVINSLLYTTVYNPLKQYGSTDKCSARIVGGSERQIYCLPYGICSEETSINGTGGFISAGQGIQELALGAFNKDNTNLKVLIGTTTLAERIKADNRVDFNGGGDGSGSEYIFNERYTFQPKAWYERSQ